MASAWNTKKESNSAMKEKELGAVTPSKKRTKRMKPAFDAGIIDEEGGIIEVTPKSWTD